MQSHERASDDAQPIHIRFWSQPQQADFCRRVLALPTAHLTTQQLVARRLLWHINEHFAFFLQGDGIPDDYLDYSESVIEACQPFFKTELAHTRATVGDVAPPTTHRRFRR